MVILLWPRLEDDYMEIGESGWIAVGQGIYKNIYNNHIVDEIGREFDENGLIIYDPSESE